MARSSSPQDGVRPRRILIVENDELMHSFYKTLFRKHKEEFACRFAKSSEAALEHLRAGGVEAAILDWDLPGISGIDLVKDIRAKSKTSGIRVMVISGKARSEDQVRALESGADDYLTKPFQVEILMARLRSLLRR